MRSPKEEKVSSYFSRVASSYDHNSNRALWKKFRVAESRAILSLLDLQPSHSVFEVGSGTGYYASKIQPLVSGYTGIDICPAMANQAVKNGFSVSTNSLEDFPAVRTYDRLLAAGVLEFAEDPQLFLRKLKSLMAPVAGRLVLLLPTTNLPGYFYKYWHDLRGCPVSLQSDSTLKHILASEKLQIVGKQTPTLISQAIAITGI